MARKRRRFLELVATTGGIALAGCSGGGDGGGGDGGGGDGGGDGGDSGGAGGGGGGGGSGSGGESFSGSGQVNFFARTNQPSANNNIDDFETLRLSFDRVDMTTESSDTTQVSLGSTVDLTQAIDAGTASITSGTELGSGEVSAGRYVDGQWHVSVAEATKADGTTPSQEFVFGTTAGTGTPVPWNISNTGAIEVQDGTTHNIEVSFQVSNSIDYSSDNNRRIWQVTLGFRDRMG